MSASSFLTVLVDAALRSLLVAVVVGLGLAISRTRNVVAQKAAWMLVLGAALLMPWAARWAAQAAWMPHGPALRVPSLRADSAAALPAAPSSGNAVVAAAALPSAEDLPLTRMEAKSPSLHTVKARTPRSDAAVDQRLSAAIHASLPAAVAAAPVVRKVETLRLPHLSGLSIALLVYAGVSAVLLLRLFYGLCAAGWLWFGAAPLKWDVYIDAEGLSIRASKRLSSPVTIGSGIVLPAGFETWDGEKLRIVLAHEASHVRQGDFWLQLCASIYTAIFWFSPLGWWLKHKLSDLSETISDGAAVELAASHASYAQVLLEFAAQPRQIPIGVAMANHGRLIPRIERLLNESSFRQAFAGGRARIATAVLLVPAALFAATTMVRVEAAQQTPPQQDVAPPPAVAPVPEPATGVAAPPAADAITFTPQAPAAAPAPPDVAPPSSPTTPAIAPAAPSADTWMTLRDGKNVLMLNDKKAMAQWKGQMDRWNGQLSRMNAAERARMMADQARMMASLKSPMFAGKGAWFKYGFGNDGNSYAYVTGSGESNTHFSGNWYEGSKAEIEKARKIAHGDFIWFERDGKSYVIDDPAAVAQLKPMQDKMEALGAQQEELGKQQEELGKQQEALSREQEQASVPTPDMTKELAQLTEAIKKLDAKKGGTVTQEELGELESKIGDLQGKIGDIQGSIGEKQGEFGEKQGALGEKQGELGEKQGRLGEEQGRIAREMDGKVLAMIDQYLKDGKAKLVP